MTLLYLNNGLCDLLPNTIVALTLKANEFGSPTVRNLNYTNQFKIPFTENNDRIFGSSRILVSESTVPYRPISARLLINGVEIVNNGVAVIKKASSSYELFIISGAANFFETIKSKKLSALDFSAYNTNWDGATITSLINTTSGIVAPVMDYGKFAYPAGANVNISIDTDTYLPSVYYKTVLDQIFTDAGYTTSGSAFTSTKLSKKIIAFSRDKFKYSEEFADDRRYSGIATGSQSIVNPSSAQAINFPTSVISNTTYWDGTNKYVTDDSDVPTDTLFIVKVTYTLTLTVTGGTVDIQVYNSVGGVSTISSGVGSGTYVLSGFDVSVYDSSFTQIRVVNASGTPTVDIGRGDVRFEPSLEVFRNAGVHVYFQYLLPDVTQTEFVKDFMIDSGVIFSEVDGVIYAKTLNEIILDRTNAKNWTQKRVRQLDEISFESSYGQRNYFAYSGSDIISNPNFGRGFFDLDNTTLETEKTVLNSLSWNTETLEPMQCGILMASVNAYEPSERSYRIIFTGTNGTANVNVNGVNYLATFSSNLNTTAANFVSTHAAALLALGITLTVVTGAQVQFTDQEDVIIIVTSGVTGDLNSTPNVSSDQKLADTEEISNSIGIRFLLVRDKYSFEPSLGNETNTLYTSYKVAYFFDPNQTYNMLLQDSLENISYFTDALSHSKMVSREYMLTELDVSDFDFFTPVFDLDSYFIVDTISNYVQGKPTKVTLLKI